MSKAKLLRRRPDIASSRRGKASHRVRPPTTTGAPRIAASHRLGDLRAAARMIARLEQPARLDLEQKRQMLADLCRLIGARLQAGRAEPAHRSMGVTRAVDGAPAASTIAAVTSPKPIAEPDRVEPADVHLSPRMRQTLNQLLRGDSEKQAARALGLSPHTVHVYVKAIYRRFGVVSRGELLARFVRR